MKNSARVDLNDKNLDNVRFGKVNSLLAVREHLTAKLYVDNAMDETTLVRSDKNNDFDNNFLIHRSHKTLNSEPTDDNHGCNQSLSRFLDWKRKETWFISSIQRSGCEIDNNKLTCLDSITVNGNPISDNELANKKYIDDSFGNGTLARFNQMLEKILVVSVGDIAYNLTKYNGEQIIDTIFITPEISGWYLLQQVNIKCNDKNNAGKITIFIRATKTSIPTGNTGASLMPPIADSFMYMETREIILNQTFALVLIEQIIF